MSHHGNKAVVCHVSSFVTVCLNVLTAWFTYLWSCVFVFAPWKHFRSFICAVCSVFFVCSAFLYMVVFSLFAEFFFFFVKLVKMFFFKATCVLSICMCFLKLQCVGLSGPPYEIGYFTVKVKSHKDDWTKSITGIKFDTIPEYIRT